VNGKQSKGESQRKPSSPIHLHENNAEVMKHNDTQWKKLVKTLKPIHPWLA